MHPVSKKPVEKIPPANKIAANLLKRELTPVVCSYFKEGRCASCDLMSLSHAEQLNQKTAQLREKLSPFKVQQWLPPVSGPQWGFRSKAKMVALGNAHEPVLGIVSPDGKPVSLCDCPLYPPDMQQLLHRLERFIQQAGIPPYRIDKRRGELKFILLTRSHASGEFMLRFVMRSPDAIARIERELPKLLAEFPKITVVSVNLQPVPMARLEGEQEIFISTERYLAEEFNEVPLFIRPKSFFQTNPEMASALYATAREWTAQLAATSIWDLFCGVGGFGLHCTPKNGRLVGIEIEPEAIACAKWSAQKMGLTDVTFTSLDSTHFTEQTSPLEQPDLIIVNPPRRGLGVQLCNRLSQLAPPYLLYSSCEAETLAEDLNHLSDYQVEKVQLFDMFVHSHHYEVLTLLKRNP